MLPRFGSSARFFWLVHTYWPSSPVAFDSPRPAAAASSLAVSAASGRASRRSNTAPASESGRAASPPRPSPPRHRPPSSSVCARSTWHPLHLPSAGDFGELDGRLLEPFPCFRDDETCRCVRASARANAHVRRRARGVLLSEACSSCVASRGRRRAGSSARRAPPRVAGRRC